jgi:hypothetical protein
MHHVVVHHSTVASVLAQCSADPCLIPRHFLLVFSHNVYGDCNMSQTSSSWGCKPHTTTRWRGASDRSAHCDSVSVVTTYRELQEQAAGMLAVWRHRAYQESVFMEACQGSSRETQLLVGTVQPWGSSWLVTEWTLNTTAWTIQRNSRMVIKYGCTAWLGPQGSHRSYNLNGKDHTRSSTTSVTWSTGPSAIFWGYSRWAALRKEQFDMMPTVQIHWFPFP